MVVCAIIVLMEISSVFRGCNKMGEAKARLNEYCQKNNFKIAYHTDVEGPPHDPV